MGSIKSSKFSESCYMVFIIRMFLIWAVFNKDQVGL